MTNARKSVTAIALAALALAACGGGDDQAAPAATDIAAEAQAASDDAIAAADSVLDALPDEIPDTVAAAIQEATQDAVDNATDGLDMSEKCKQITGAFGAAMASAMVPDSADGDAVQAQFDAMKAELPEELQADVETVAAAIGRMVEARQTDPAADPTEFLMDSDVSAAGERLNAYLEDECPELT
jgi:hypothetical protein